jgi:hypothetical protein
MRSRLTFPFALTLSALLLAASPEPRPAGAMQCGAGTLRLCKTNESCVNILFFSQCTTRYYYYPA